MLGNEESSSPLSTSFRAEDTNGTLNTNRSVSEPILTEKSTGVISINEVVPRAKRKVDPQLLSSSLSTSLNSFSAPSQPVPGGVHGLAWETCRSWLSAPHWFPELQQIAGLLPEVDCFRAPMNTSRILTSLTSTSSTLDETESRISIPLLGGVPPNVALSRLQFDCEDISSLARNCSRTVSIPLGRGRSRPAVPQLSFSSTAKTGNVHPAVSSPPMHQSSGTVTALTTYSTSFSETEERSAAAVILAHYSHDLIQRISRCSKFKLDACVEAALDRNRYLPSVPLESSGYSFASNPDVAREAIAAISAVSGSSVASPSLLFSQKIRIPRVFISRSGMCTIRRVFIPHSSIPSVFHCSPPLANVILPSQLTSSSLSNSIEKHDIRNVSLSHPLSDGYLLRKPIRPPSLVQFSTESSMPLGPPLELPEPMLVNSDEQRASIAAHLMLRGIASSALA
jgi:hypothetical protein